MTSTTNSQAPARQSFADIVRDAADDLCRAQGLLIELGVDTAAARSLTDGQAAALRELAGLIERLRVEVGYGTVDATYALAAAFVRSRPATTADLIATLLNGYAPREEGR